MIERILITVAFAALVVLVVFAALYAACDVSADEPLPIRSAAEIDAPTDVIRPAAVPVHPGLHHYADGRVPGPVVRRATVPVHPGPRHAAPVPVLVGTGAFHPHVAQHAADAPRHLRADWRDATHHLTWSPL